MSKEGSRHSLCASCFSEATSKKQDTQIWRRHADRIRFWLDRAFYFGRAKI
ncbi:MAG: hypothetical protein ACRC2R_21070 [Xenococcaceae cyanobacterium]